MKRFDGTAEHLAFKLNNALIEGDTAIHSGKETKRSLASNICALDCRAVFQDRQEGEDAPLWKINVFENATRFANDRSEL